MDNTTIKNIVLFKPTGADFCHSLAYKELPAEHLDGDEFLRFEYKGNRIASFDSVQQPSISVETEPISIGTISGILLGFDLRQPSRVSIDIYSRTLVSRRPTGTTSLSLRDNKPVVVIQGKSNFLNFSFLRIVDPYLTVPITSGYAEGLKIRFQPVVLSKKYPPLHRYNILDEQQGTHLGILLIPSGGKEITLAFEEEATETQKRIIVGASAFIIADIFRVKQLAEYVVLFSMLFIFVIFLIFLYFQ